MHSIKFLICSLTLFCVIDVSLNELNGKCGYPGKPYRAKLEPDNKLSYDEGEEVSYQCTDFWSFVNTRRCEKGKWTGEQPRCGDFVTGILMKDSRLEDISDETKPQVVWEHMDMNLTDRPWKYPNVFTSYRFNKSRLRVHDDHKYRWSFNFTAPAVKHFVRVNFNLINYTHLPLEVRDNFQFNCSMYVSPHRRCELLHQSGDKWRESGQKTNFDFTCDSISPDDYKKDLADPGDYMVMETQSSINISHDLIALFLGKSYTDSKGEILCGDPEVPYSQISRFNVQFKDYVTECKSKYDYISSANDIIPETALHGVKCGPDMRWYGSYANCVPKKPCPLDALVTAKSTNTTVITSFVGLDFFNQSLYYAIEGTQAIYGCLNPSADIIVGKESRTCLKSGQWSGSEPHCYNPNEGARFPVWTLIAILFSALLFIVCLTAILFFVYTKRIKTRIAKQIERQNRTENEKYNQEVYDDIDYAEGKQMYDTTYEAVDGEQEVRYADPYYASNRGNADYVDIPPNVVDQSSDDYWRLPTMEPSYLEMTCSNKSSPNYPRKPPKEELNVYTYEL